MLHSCTSTTELPPTGKNTDSHITIWRGNNIDETIMSSPIQKNSTATWNTVTWKISTWNTISAGTGVIYSTGLQDVIKLQLKKWPEVIMEVDCNIFTGESKKYCVQQQEEINDRKNELNWEKVLKMWPEYIRTFDCKKILSPYWQWYCKEYQLNLK
jgi:hypothetical protein